MTGLWQACDRQRYLICFFFSSKLLIYWLLTWFKENFNEYANIHTFLQNALYRLIIMTRNETPVQRLKAINVSTRLEQPWNERWWVLSSMESCTGLVTETLWSWADVEGDSVCFRSFSSVSCLLDTQAHMMHAHTHRLKARSFIQTKQTDVALCAFAGWNTDLLLRYIDTVYQT